MLMCVRSAVEKAKCIFSELMKVLKSPHVRLMREALPVFDNQHLCH
jgi:hypothetical protein